MNRIFTTCAAIVLVCASPLAEAGGDSKNGQTKAEVCAACHGADGNSTSSPEFPKLAGQHADYIVRALTDYQTGKRTNAIMQGFVANLSKQDMWDLAAYFTSQPGDLFTPTNY